MKGRKIIGIVIVIIGLGILSYPMIKQAYSEHRQDELKAAFQEILKINEAASEPAVTITSGAEPTDTSHIDFEEAEVVEDTQNADNVKDRLKGQTVIGLIEIETLDLIYAIVEGTTEDNLGVAIGHMTNTANLGEVGNCALAGHRGGTSGPYFKDIHKLVAGDEIKVTDVYGKEYVYKVTESFLVKPTEVWVAENDTDQKMLTLITCQENGTLRLIVRAVSE